MTQEKSVGGQLGNKRSAAHRTYDRLDRYIQDMEAERPLFATGAEWDSLKRAHEEIHTYSLRQNAIAKLNREFKNGITDEQLAKLVVFLREHDVLCVINPEDIPGEAQILCSLGLFQAQP